MDHLNPNRKPDQTRFFLEKSTSFDNFIGALCRVEACFAVKPGDTVDPVKGGRGLTVYVWFTTDENLPATPLA